MFHNGTIEELDLNPADWIALSLAVHALLDHGLPPCVEDLAAAEQAELRENLAKLRFKVNVIREICGRLHADGTYIRPYANRRATAAPGSLHPERN